MRTVVTQGQQECGRGKARLHQLQPQPCEGTALSLPVGGWA
jgi:hypothetical protein